LTTGADIYQLEIGAVPPSLNGMKLGSRGAAMKFHRHKKEWEGWLGMALDIARVPKGLSRVKASAELRFPTRRRRDEGNFRFMLEKALGDALQYQRVLPDDSADEYTFSALTFDPTRGDPRTIITLEVFRGRSD
jgi:hypothetical protein